MQRCSEFKQMNPLLLIVGMPGAGKSTVVRYLEAKGWPVVHFGQITLDEVERLGLPPSQQSEKTARESLRKHHGSVVYAQMSLPAILGYLKDTFTIVDGLYSWDEYLFLKENVPNPLYIISVSADRRIRYARLASRATRSLSSSEAEARDLAEIQTLQKGGPIAIADFTILNNGAEAELMQAVNRVIVQVYKDTKVQERDSSAKS